MMKKKDAGNNQEALSFKKWVLQNLFSIAAVIVALANVWIASKLAPLARDIDIIRSEVLANANNIEDIEIKCSGFKTEIWEELKYIRNQVDSVNAYLRK